MSTGKPRPIVPLYARRAISIFNVVHSLSHYGPRPTQKAVSARFIWKGLKRDIFILQWCSECHDCMASKVSCHVHATREQRELPPDRFMALLVNLVGPPRNRRAINTCSPSWTASPGGLTRYRFLIFGLKPFVTLSCEFGSRILGFPPRSQRIEERNLRRPPGGTYTNCLGSNSITLHPITHKLMV